jgi:hypothetical protein
MTSSDESNDLIFNWDHTVKEVSASPYNSSDNSLSPRRLEDYFAFLEQTQPVVRASVQPTSRSDKVFTL